MTYNLANNKNAKGCRALEFFASINNCPNEEYFITGFTMALHKCRKELNADLVIIENISDNTLIINSLSKNNIKAIFNSPTAYFYYNYASRPLLSDKVFILN
jgi:hypothetical protein